MGQVGREVMGEGGLALEEGISGVRRTRSVQGVQMGGVEPFPMHELEAGPEQGKAGAGESCWSCTHRALLLPQPVQTGLCSSKEGSDSCPPGVSSQLEVQRSPFFLLLFTPCKEFSVNKRNCFIINLMFIPSSGL